MVKDKDTMVLKYVNGNTYYLQSIGTDFIPSWNGLTDNAQLFTQERARSLKSILKSRYPDDSFNIKKKNFSDQFDISLN